MKTAFFKNTDTTTIYIQLGNACNLRCKYCYHNNDDQNYYPPPKINDDIFSFIEECCARQRSKVKLRFFGGEPLMYVKEIKYIVEHLTHIPNLENTLITNGSLITRELADYFNEHNFSITVSWDGHHFSKKYRGYDAFEENRDNIFRIKKLNILTSIVELTKIKEIIADIEKEVNIYYARQNRTFGMSWTLIDDLGTQSEFVDRHSKEEISAEFRWFANRIKEGLFLPPNKKRPIDTVLESLFYADLQGAVSTMYHSQSIMRGSDNPTTFSLDLEGNLYEMHRFPEVSKYSKKVCTIYDNYFVYLQQILGNTDFGEQMKRNSCKMCSCYGLCRAPGPKLDVAAEDETCKNRQATFRPFIEMLEEICGKPLKEALMEWFYTGDYKER